MSGAVLHMVGEESSTGPSGTYHRIAYIANSTFTGNLADASVGPGLPASASATYSSLEGSGGVISFFGTILWIHHSAFEDNGAGTLGGAMMVQQWCFSVSNA